MQEKSIKIGNPKTTIDNPPSGFIRYYPQYKFGDLMLTELARLVGVSRQSIYKYLAIYGGV